MLRPSMCMNMGGHLSMNGDGQVCTWNRKARLMGARHAPYSQVLWGDPRKHPDLGLRGTLSALSGASL